MTTWNTRLFDTTGLPARLMQVVCSFAGEMAQAAERRAPAATPAQAQADSRPVVWRTRAGMQRRPLHIYVDAQDPRRARMAGSFSDICATLDQMVRLQDGDNLPRR